MKLKCNPAIQKTTAAETSTFWNHRMKSEFKVQPEIFYSKVTKNIYETTCIFTCCKNSYVKPLMKGELLKGK